MTLRALTIFVVLSALPLAIAKAQTPPDVQTEVEYLLQYVETSGCSFYRNGTWYDGAHARAHLRAKYDYLAGRQLIGTAEDFIDKVATKSSVSGEPYKIRCGDGREVESGPWLHQMLGQYRASEPSDGTTAGRASREGLGERRPP
jgi:hypothetical protein